MTTKHKFGDYLFDSETGDLSQNNDTVRLEPTVSRLLLYFLENPGRVISRDELIEKVWFNRIVSDDPINRCVSVLRHCLNGENKQSYIETVPRKGYLAKFPLDSSPAQSESTSHSPEKSKKSVTIGWRTIVLVAIIIVFISIEWIDLA